MSKFGEEAEVVLAIDSEGEVIEDSAGITNSAGESLLDFTAVKDADSIVKFCVKLKL
jgi:hypothetical protein